MSQSAPSYRKGHSYHRTCKDNVGSLHPAREKGQKSSFQRLSTLTSETRKNKNRCSLSSNKSYSEEDSSSRESFTSSEFEGIKICNDARQTNIFSRIYQPTSSYEQKVSGTKKVAFIIGDGLQEDEIGEDAFQHNFSMPLQENHSDIEDSGVYCYDTQESWDVLKNFLTDHLENQILKLFKNTFKGEYSVWALRSILNSVIPELVRLSEDEPYGVKGANIILKFSKLQDKQNNYKAQESKFSKIRRSSNLSSCSTNSDHGSMNGCEEAETLGFFEMCKDTVSTFELVLALKEEKRHLGLSIKNWLSHLTGSMPIHVISPEFSLTKRKLYRMSS